MNTSHWHCCDLRSYSIHCHPQRVGHQAKLQSLSSANGLSCSGSFPPLVTSCPEPPYWFPQAPMQRSGLAGFVLISMYLLWWCVRLPRFIILVPFPVLSKPFSWTLRLCCGKKPIAYDIQLSSITGHCVLTYSKLHFSRGLLYRVSFQSCVFGLSDVTTSLLL